MLSVAPQEGDNSTLDAYSAMFNLTSATSLDSKFYINDPWALEEAQTSAKSEWKAKHRIRAQTGRAGGVAAAGDEAKGRDA